MNKFQILLAIVLALAGCKSREERLAIEAESDHNTCASMGYSRGTALYLQCRQMQTQNRLAENIRDEARMEGIGNGLQRAGQALQSIDSPSRTSTTDCSPRFNGGFSCSTY